MRMRGKEPTDNFPRGTTVQWLSHSYFLYQQVFMNSDSFQFIFPPLDSTVTSSKKESLVLAKNSISLSSNGMLY